MEQIYYLETGSNNPFYNLAFEEYILTHRLSKNYFMLWQNEKTIVIGQNQNAEEEINRGFVEKQGLHVVRRSTGGGAVFHDLGNLNYSFITEKRSQNGQSNELMRPIIKALRGLGVHAVPSGRNDILVEGRKISGTAQRVFGDRVLFHGTLLFDSDLEAVAGALQVDPLKYQSKSVKSVRSRIGNIRDYLITDMDTPTFWEYMKKAVFPLAIPCTVSPEEEEEIQQLCNQKYATYEWTFEHPIPYTMKNKHRWPGGSLEIAAEVKEGYLVNLSVSGDFLSVKPLDKVLAALSGVRFIASDVREKLESLCLADYLGTITQEEFLKTMFDMAE